MIFKIFKHSEKLLLLFVIVALFSCTPRKKQIYFNHGENTSNEVFVNALSNYKLQKGDQLYINVQTLDEKTFNLFNSEWNKSTSKSDLSIYIESYTICDSGFIKLPIIGEISVYNKTLGHAQKDIQKQIDNYLLDAIVSIKLVNYKVTVLGEVNRPGTFKVYDNNIDVLEAISLAGDLTVFGNRKNIMIIRKSQENKVAYLDITNKSIIGSEFFKLMPNDIIYVEPTVAKTLGFKEFPFTILFSGITTVLVLINFLSK